MKGIFGFLCFMQVTVYGYSWMFNGRPFDGKVGVPIAPSEVTLPEEQYFESQKVDHFDGSNFQYWRQRYYVNNATYRTYGPIFVMLGGDSEADPAWLVDSAWQQYASDHGAFLILLEHRYYGKSRPVPDLSMPNLKYLSSKQAVVDVVEFITWFKELFIYRYLQDSSVILFGGSYAGSLAVWTRSRYPYIVLGAVASSAPVVSVMDFKDYFSSVSETLEETNSACRSAVANATSALYDMWGQHDKYNQLQNMFMLCEEINHDYVLDLSVLFYSLAENIAGVVQYNNVSRKITDDKANNITVEQVCDIMTDESRGDSVQRYADVNTLMLDTYGERCLNIRYAQLASALNNTRWNNMTSMGSRQWLYQSCSELGWMQSSYTANQTFGPWYLFPFNFTTDLCDSVFNPPSHWDWFEIQKNIDETNRYYGGRSMTISNTVFVNGMSDPWRSVGMLKKPSGALDYIEIINVNGTAHCADMYPPSSRDAPQLTEARAQISYTIWKWLSTP